MAFAGHSLRTSANVKLRRLARHTAIWYSATPEENFPRRMSAYSQVCLFDRLSSQAYNFNIVRYSRKGGNAWHNDATRDSSEAQRRTVIRSAQSLWTWLAFTPGNCRPNWQARTEQLRC